MFPINFCASGNYVVIITVWPTYIVQTIEMFWKFWSEGDQINLTTPKFWEELTTAIFL